MSISTINAGKKWSKTEERKLGSLVKNNTPAIVIGLILGRSPGAVQSKANELNVSLKFANQSPFKRRRK